MKPTPIHPELVSMMKKRSGRCVRIMYQDWQCPSHDQTSWAVQVIAGDGKCATLLRLAFGRLADSHHRIFITGTEDITEMVELGSSRIHYFGYWLIVPGSSPEEASDHPRVRQLVEWLMEIQRLTKSPSIPKEHDT